MKRSFICASIFVRVDTAMATKDTLVDVLLRFFYKCLIIKFCVHFLLIFVCGSSSNLLDKVILNRGPRSSRQNGQWPGGTRKNDAISVIVFWRQIFGCYVGIYFCLTWSHIWDGIIQWFQLHMCGALAFR